MSKPNIANTKDFMVKFGTSQNEIDALTLTYSLLGLTSTLQELNTYISPEKRLDVKIKATSPGSFELLIQLAEHAAPMVQLLPFVIADNQEYLGGLMKLLAEFLKLKSELGRNPPKVVERIDNQTIVEGNAGNITVNNAIYNFYQSNRSAQSSTNRAFRSLAEDEEVKSLAITDNESGEEVISLDREVFPELAIPTELDDDESTQLVTKIAKITVLKAVFDRSRLWEFILQGHKISAHILDESFWKRVSNRQLTFGQGDTLKVKLEVKQKYIQEADTYENESYTVLEVLDHEHASSDKQQGLIPEPTQERDP